MPVQSNVGVQNVGTIAWDGATAYPADIRKFTRFGWSFQITADITADTTFTVQAAPPSDTDNCVPGEFEDVEVVPICEAPVETGELATFTIPEGTVAGSICAGTIPCRPGAFVQLVAGEGDTASVLAVLIRQGPMI